MRVMLMIKGDPEPGAVPGEELLTRWAGTTTSCSRPACCWTWPGCSQAPRGGGSGSPTGTASSSMGPFPESKQLVAGYWILQVPSMEEAVEWAKRAPFEALSRIYPGEYGATGEIEIRRVFEPEGSDAAA
jgi:YCII-related domain